MRFSLMLYDVLLFLVFFGVYGTASAVTAAVWLQLSPLMSWPWLGFLLPVMAVVFMLALIFCVAAFNFILPNMKSGHYTAPASGMFYLWTLYLTLNRVLFFDPIQNLMLYSPLLRFLALRALGAKMAYGSSVSARVALTDVPFIEVGEDCIIGANSLLTGHYLNKGNLFLGHIKIGNRVNVGGYCRMGPGVTIGDDTWIGADCQIAPMVTVGKNCTLEPGSVLPPGTQLADGETFPPQETEVW